MLVELAAANAAFDVVKQTIQNGREIYEAGEALAQYFGLKNEIQKKAHQHGYKSDIAAFMAAEELNAKEAELKEMMVYQGRAGMWDDWLAFQAEMKRSREQAEKEERDKKNKRKKAIVESFLYSIYAICFILAIGAVVFFTYAITKIF